MEREKRLIDAINKEMPRLPDTNYKLGYSHGLNKAKDIVLKLDAVEVVHGRWIDIVDYGGGKCFGFCSNCAAEQEALNATALKAFHKYCRWCGAKMDGGNEDI